MRHTTFLRTSVALVAATALLGACSDDADDDKAADQPSTSPATGQTTSPVADDDLPDGVRALPARAAGKDFVDLTAGRYRIDLGEGLSFDVDLPEGTSAHDDGLFLASGSAVLKVELAGREYGAPRDPCAGGILPSGAGVDALVDDLAGVPVYEVSEPETVSLGGADGFYLEANSPEAYDASGCSSKGSLQLPSNPDTAVSAPPPYDGRWWVLDVHGQRVVVQQNCWDCSAAQLDAARPIPSTLAFTAAP